MNKISLLIYCFLAISITLPAQTVNIFVSTPIVNYPDVSAINSTYASAGFSTVNVTSGTIDATLIPSNYDVVYVTEFYDYGVPGPLFITAAQRQMVENFINNGGHVVWVAESIDDYIFNPGTPPINSNAINTINALYGTNLQYGPYFANGGAGPPNLPRIHPSTGPGGLSGQTSVIASGSYATLLNVPNESKVYTSEFFDNTTFFDVCTHTTLALFPAYPLPNAGTVIISTELGAPFHGSSSGPFGTGPPVFNTILDAAIATLHFKLVTGASLAIINNWSSQSSHTNPNCSPQIILPVDALLQFNATALSRNVVKLNWKMREDVNLSQVTTERSSDGIEWEVLNKIDHSVNIRCYETFDKSPLKGVSYYRLRYADEAEEELYSAIKAVEIKRNNNRALIYPNPVQNILTIEQEGISMEQLLLFDALGRIVRFSYQEENLNKVTIDVSPLSEGIYCLKTNYGTYKIYKK